MNATTSTQPPHIDVRTLANLPQMAHKDGQRRQRNCRRDCQCRDSRISCPRRNAHRRARRRRHAGCRLARSRNGGTPGTTPQSDRVRPHGPPVARIGQCTGKKPSQLIEVNSTSESVARERTMLGRPLCGTAVHAPLAPAQPPPPAGLASDPACRRTCIIPVSNQIGGTLDGPSADVTVVI